MESRTSRILLNPFLLLVVVVAAVWTGLRAPDIGHRLAPFGDYYLSLLKMIILPYLFVTVTAGVARMASDPDAKRFITRMLLVYPSAMVLSAAVAMLSTFVLPPGGTVDTSVLAELGDIVHSDGNGTDGTGIVITLEESPEAAEEEQHSLLEQFIPDNIFAALSEGDSLKTVVFCIVFGAALAHSAGAAHGAGGSHARLLSIFTVVQEACVEVIRWLNLLLPFALFAMLAAQVASVGVAPLLSLGRFIATQALAGGVLLAIALAILCHRARVSPFAALARLRHTIIMAVSTRSSTSCIPLAVQEMTDNLRFERKGVDLVLPLGITMCRIATIAYLLIGTVFIAQVYGVDIGVLGYVTIFFASLMAGLAAIGTTGAMAVLLISLVAEPLKLPVEAAVVLFLAVDPVIGMIRTFVLVYCNCAMAALILPRPLRTESVAEGGAIAMPAAAAARAAD